MNFKIIVAIVGIVVSMAFSVSCQEDDVACAQQFVCDQNGMVYSNLCDFFVAQEEDDTLEIVDCPVQDSMVDYNSNEVASDADGETYY